MATLPLLQANRSFEPPVRINALTWLSRGVIQPERMAVATRDEARRRSATTDAVRCILRPGSVAGLARSRSSTSRAALMCEAGKAFTRI
jgi:hypothetical protein